MAEFLILKKSSWATTRPSSWDQEKFDARQIAGDIVEVKANGFYRIEHLKTGNAGWDRDLFAVIRFSTIPLSTVEAYAMKHASPTGIPHKYRYRLSLWDSLAWNKNNVTVNGKTFSEWYLDLTKIDKNLIVDKVA